MSYSQGYGPFLLTSAPVAGTDEVQTLTIAGGPPTTLTFKLSFQGLTTSAIPWSNVNATLLASINTALNALGSVGTSGVVATAGTLTAGIGTILLTYSGANLAKKAQPLMTVADIVQTGTATTLAITETTPGVDASFRGSAMPGALLHRIDAGNVKAYQNTGTLLAPTWTIVGTQA